MIGVQSGIEKEGHTRTWKKTLNVQQKSGEFRRLQLTPLVSALRLIPELSVLLTFEQHPS
jgi:hypothetical protein